MDLSKKALRTASLIAILILAGSFNALGSKYSVGSGNDDWWISYPGQSEGSAGGEVNHPGWVLDALKSKPVLVYVHRDCSYCTPQTEDVKNIGDEFGSKITVFEISAMGTDARSTEALRAYDPNGGVNYVPMTAIITLAPNADGKVEPVWHSAEDLTGEEWIKKYVDDSLSLYDENSAGWKK
jgi:hypothetical protein